MKFFLLTTLLVYISFITLFSGVPRKYHWLRENRLRYGACRKIIQYTVLLHTGKGGGGEGELTREKVRGAIAHKTGTKNTNMTSVYKLY